MVDDLVRANRTIQQKHISSALGVSKERVQHFPSEFGYRKIRAEMKPCRNASNRIAGTSS